MNKLICLLAIICFSFCGSCAIATELSADEKKIMAYVEDQIEQEAKFLEQVVNINSGTKNFDGVRNVATVFSDALEQAGLKSSWLEMEHTINRAGHVVAKTPSTGSPKGQKLLLMGHMDTVFPKDSAFQKYEQRGDFAFGPGIQDMKGGIVVIVYALKALHETGLLKDRQITVFLTGDEEDTGQPIEKSREALVQVAKQSDVALNFEGGGEGYAVVARRGYTNWELTVKGVRAHSGWVFSEDTGAGAANETARILNEFYTHLRSENSLTFNTGMMMAGTNYDYNQRSSTGSIFGKTNVVPSKAYIRGDIRALSIEQLNRVQNKMRRIVADNLPQTSAEINFRTSYPPMPETRGNASLFQQLNQVSVDLGQKPLTKIDPKKRGAADISFVAPYVASLDGLGPWGDGEHSLAEKMDLTSLKPVTQRAAILIYRLTR